MATKKTSGKAKAASKSASKPAGKGATPQKQPAQVPVQAREATPALRRDAELAARDVHPPVIREDGELAVKENASPTNVKTAGPARTSETAPKAKVEAGSGAKPAAKAPTQAAASNTAAKNKGMRREISPRPKPQGNPYKPMGRHCGGSDSGDRQHQNLACGPGRSRGHAILYLRTGPGGPALSVRRGRIHFRDQFAAVAKGLSAILGHAGRRSDCGDSSPFARRPRWECARRWAITFPMKAGKAKTFFL